MIVSKSLKGEEFINRKGIVGRVNLPQSKLLKDPKKGFDISISLGSKELSFVEGDSIYAIHECIGILEETEFTLFLAGKYLVTELHWGKLYFKDEDGKIYAVNNLGEISYPDRTQNINWLTLDRVRLYLDFVVGNKYNLTDGNDLTEYISNLVFTVLSATTVTKTTYENRPVETASFKFKVQEYFSDLGMDEFEYEVKEKVEKVPLVTYEVQDDVDENEHKTSRKKELQEETEYRRIKDGDDVEVSEDFEDFGFTEETAEELENQDVEY